MTRVSYEIFPYRQPRPGTTDSSSSDPFVPTPLVKSYPFIVLRPVFTTRGVRHTLPRALHWGLPGPQFNSSRIEEGLLLYDGTTPLALDDRENSSIYYSRSPDPTTLHLPFFSTPTVFFSTTLSTSTPIYLSRTPHKSFSVFLRLFTLNSLPYNNLTLITLLAPCELSFFSLNLSLHGNTSFDYLKLIKLLSQ